MVDSNNTARATRLTGPLVLILIAIESRSKMGERTTARDLMDHFTGMKRHTVNNALKAIFDHGLTERTAVEPYSYKLRDDLDDEKKAFVERVREVWIEQNADAIDAQFSPEERDRRRAIRQVQNDIEGLQREYEEKLRDLDDLKTQLDKTLAEAKALMEGGA